MKRAFDGLRLIVCLYVICVTAWIMIGIPALFEAVAR